jgi:hypothetical protein
MEKTMEAELPPRESVEFDVVVVEAETVTQLIGTS